MGIKHSGTRRFDGSCPAYSPKGQLIRDLLMGLRHIDRHVKPEQPKQKTESGSGS